MTAGSPVSSSDRARLLESWAKPLLRHVEADAAIASLKSRRSSAISIARRLAPIRRMPRRSSTPRLRELDREVERGLAADRGQHGVRPLALEDLLQHLGGQRLDVGAVGVLGVGHDRRRVGVHQRRRGCPPSRRALIAWVPE